MEWECLKKKGFLSSKEAMELPALPSWERILKGPVAVMVFIVSHH